MDISPVGTITIPRICGDVPCGQCAGCHKRAMLNTASYALRAETGEEGDPKGALLDLLDKLGLSG
ncbi:hypothetical protein SEA_SATIS_20 [Streptomyces phage Satis]|nr:hypothetical protein SEA_SATIS_20 [Streptomyces phage Satis]QBZ71919.1 hypothetical protein SEA_KRADAL_20 [Streptomyces phage Kradal]QPL14337.1 hypothetical protein SEA_EHYELIMAYOE_20 [Streptomyces phage EhyElimayoE]